MRAYLGLVLTVAFWGASLVALKVLLRELGPATITVLRFAVGLAVLAAVAAARHQLQAPRARDLPWLALLGFLGITLHQWLQANGLLSSTATVTSWIVARSRSSWRSPDGWFARADGAGARGILMAAAGVSLVVSNGDLRGLLAGRPGPGRFVDRAQRRQLGGLHHLEQAVHANRTALRPVAMMLYVMGFGWAFSLLWLGATGGAEAILRLSLGGWWAMAFLGLGCSGLAYLFWYDALDRIDATQAGVFLYFGPLVTAALAWPLLGEPIGGAMLAGGAAILAGVWMVNRATSSPGAPHRS
jgi:drug/metabolite transporter (DMT)-like permease